MKHSFALAALAAYFLFGWIAAIALDSWVPEGLLHFLNSISEKLAYSLIVWLILGIILLLIYILIISWRKPSMPRTFQTFIYTCFGGSLSVGFVVPTQMRLAGLVEGKEFNFELMSDNAETYTLTAFLVTGLFVCLFWLIFELLVRKMDNSEAGS